MDIQHKTKHRMQRWLRDFSIPHMRGGTVYSLKRRPARMGWNLINTYKWKIEQHGVEANEPTRERQVAMLERYTVSSRNTPQHRVRKKAFLIVLCSTVIISPRLCYSIDLFSRHKLFSPCLLCMYIAQNVLLSLFSHWFLPFAPSMYCPCALRSLVPDALLCPLLLHT